MGIKTTILKVKRQSLNGAAYILLYPARMLNAPDVKRVTKLPVIMGAHRGDSNAHRENTTHAIRSAVENEKYQFIEFDVQLTRDRKVIVLHTEPIVRINRRQSKAYKYTYKEINQIYGYHIPTLYEVLSIIKNRKKIDIDIKSTGSIKKDHELIDNVMKECIRLKVTNYTMVSSMNPRIIKYISKNYPEVKRGLIVDKLRNGLTGFMPSDKHIKHSYALADKIGAEYLIFHGITINNYRRILKLKPKHIKLIFWYFNDRMFIMQKDEKDELW